MCRREKRFCFGGAEPLTRHVLENIHVTYLHVRMCVTAAVCVCVCVCVAVRQWNAMQVAVMLFWVLFPGECVCVCVSST